MKRSGLVFLCLVLIGVASVQANVLSNAGFETAGATSDDAQNWQWGNPDQHGARWGNASRKDWRSHNGGWEGAIGGTWAGSNEGGMWQEKPCVPGATYTLSAWFWADYNWTNQSDQGLKIEFYSGDDGGTNYITEIRTYVSSIGESWVQKSVTAVAPTNAQWVRAVIWAVNVGSSGALQFDDLSLVAEPGTVILISQIPLWLLGALCTAPVLRSWRKTRRTVAH